MPQCGAARRGAGETALGTERINVHHSSRQRHRWAVIALAAAALCIAVPAAAAQVPPLLPEPTTTTAPPPATTAPPSGDPEAPAAPSGEQPSGSDLATGSNAAPAGAEDAGDRKG